MFQQTNMVFYKQTKIIIVLDVYLCQRHALSAPVLPRDATRKALWVSGNKLSDITEYVRHFHNTLHMTNPRPLNHNIRNHS